MHDQGSTRVKPVRPVSGPPRLTDDWRKWIAENLLLGASPADLAGSLAARGCPPAVARAEIALAQASPYLQAASILQRRVDKRDWLLRSYGRLASIDPASGDVPRRDRLPAADFWTDHYAAHRPVLLTGLIDHWPATTGWSLDRFAALAGDAEIEVQTGRDANPAYEIDSDRHRAKMPFRELLDRLRRDVPSNDYYVTANNGGQNRAALAALWPEIGDIPGYLGPADGAGFFWMGPRGTITPFHHDLTNNLLIQIAGRKRVALVPSWETPRMLNFRHCFSGHAGPAAIAALPDDVRPAMTVCTLGPGEALFIPVGWWHHVEGLDTTIGLSFTNFAAPNDFYSDYTTYGAM